MKDAPRTFFGISKVQGSAPESRRGYKNTVIPIWNHGVFVPSKISCVFHNSTPIFFRRSPRLLSYCARVMAPFFRNRSKVFFCSKNSFLFFSSAVRLLHGDPSIILLSRLCYWRSMAPALIRYFLNTSPHRSPVPALKRKARPGDRAH